MLGNAIASKDPLRCKGDTGREIVVFVDPADTVEAIRVKIQDKEGIVSRG